MFGYQESEYRVLKVKKIMVNGQPQKLEIRQQVSSNNARFIEMFPHKKEEILKSQAIEALPYIAVEQPHPEIDNALALDLLFMYQTEESAGQLEKDWETLINNPNCSVNDLNWSSYVESHITEYGRDGWVAMH